MLWHMFDADRGWIASEDTTALGTTQPLPQRVLEIISHINP